MSDQAFGTFSPRHADTRDLSTPGEFALTADFTYTDAAGATWTAPAGAVINGASIPRLFWRTIGHPMGDKYYRASILHDHHCVAKVRPWWTVHGMFWSAMRAGGVGPLKAWAMWLAVWCFGPRWRAKK